MLHWPGTPTSGEANTERLASSAKDDRIAHMLSIWSKSIRLLLCPYNDISYFILTCYSWESFDVSNHPSFPIWCYNASPHTMKSCPVPLTEIFFFQSAKHDMNEKTQLMGRGNHEQVASRLQTGSVRSQGETSLTLFCWLSITSSGRLPLWTMASFPTHDCFNLTSWHLTNLTCVP